MDPIEVWDDGAFVERTAPLDVRAHRRAKDPGVVETEPTVEPTGDWLGHLVQERRASGLGAAPSAKQLAEEARTERSAKDEGVLAVLGRLLDAEAFDEDAARVWLGRFGPLEPRWVDQELSARIALGEGADRHVTEILADLAGGAS
jgi:hypothetical protein